MSVKVCILVKHHPFMDARIFHKEAKSLVKKGYDVTLIVPKRNGFLYDVDLTPFKDKYLEPSFIHDGVKIITYDRKLLPLKKVYNNIVSGDYQGFKDDPLFSLGVAQNADIYHAHEFQSFYSGIGIKRALKAMGKDVKLIYDSHEISPDPLEKKKNNDLMQAMLIHMLKEVDHVITISEGIKSWYLIQNNRLPVDVIYNSPPFLKDMKNKPFDKNKMVVCYEGIVHPNRGGMEKIIKITEKSLKSIPNFKFKIIGGLKSKKPLPIPSELKEHIIHVGWVNYDAIPQYYEDVDLGWNHSNLQTTLKSMFALPNKFFSYLNNGIPVLTNRSSDRENFIRTHHCGLVIDQLNPSADDYADAIVYLHQKRNELKDMSANAREAMEKAYSWEHMEPKLYGVYERLLANKPQYLT